MSIATPPGLMHACYQEEFPSKLLIQIRLQAEVARLCASFYRPKRKEVAHFLSRCTPLGSSDIHFGGRGKPSPAGKPPPTKWAAGRTAQRFFRPPGGTPRSEYDPGPVTRRATTNSQTVRADFMPPLPMSKPWGRGTR